MGASVLQLAATLKHIQNADTANARALLLLGVRMLSVSQAAHACKALAAMLAQFLAAHVDAAAATGAAAAATATATATATPSSVMPKRLEDLAATPAPRALLHTHRHWSRCGNVNHKQHK